MNSENLNMFTADDVSTLERIIKNRRDVRGSRFTPKEIEPEKLEFILEAGINAPSVGFSQPWEFVIIKNAETKAQVKACFNEENKKGEAKFSGEKQDLYAKLKLEGITEAPVNIAVFYKPSAHPVLGQTTMKSAGPFSVVCAIQNMWLMARTLDLGLGWISIIDPERIKSILHAPADHQLIGYFALGYVDQFYAVPELETIGWDQRKSLDDVVIYEQYPAR